MRGNNKKMMRKIDYLDKIELSNDLSVPNLEDQKIIIQPDDENIEYKRTNTFSSFLSDDTTVRSNKTAKTFQSKPFNKELDLDIPNFSPTKYAPNKWKFAHSLFYFFYSSFLIASNIIYLFPKNYNSYNIVLLISHSCYFISSFLEWFYFKRGCIGYANLNSKIKDNIDYSIKARILRSEQGWKYFFSFFASIILIYGNIYYILSVKSNDNNKKGVIPDVEFCNINLIGVMIISLAQILKLEKILMETKLYIVKNDLSNCLIEIFFFFASLCFGTLYFYSILYNYDDERFKNFYMILRIIGCALTFLSSISLINRYYMSDYDDLNTSDLSNVTL